MPPRAAVAVKSERVAGVKSEVPSVKREAPVKTEAFIKAESSAKRAKTEPGSNVKAEHSAKREPLPPLSAKIEQLRNVKAELLRKPGLDGLLARGLQLREQAAKAKAKAASTGKRSGTKIIKVKKERTRNADGKLRKKPRITAKRRNASREAMNREIPLSEELADVLGADALSRPDAVRKLWAYCRDNGMLNPDNKREIQFDTKLEQMLGQSTATMPQLTSLLVPHFDYCRAAAMKQEPKTEPGTKKETKRESVKLEAKRVAKQEDKKDLKLKSEKVKREAATSNDDFLMDAAKAVVEDALRGTLPLISQFDATTAAVECPSPPGCFDLEAVALPWGDAAAAVVVPCSVEFREDADATGGGMQAHAEARFTGLDAEVGYSIRVRIRTSAGQQDNKAVTSDDGCTREVVLPQRSSPGKWTPREVLTWCQMQRVPELVKMVQDYGVDGETLLSLGEDDLRAAGIVAPFLLRRLLTGLAGIRGNTRTSPVTVL